MNSTGFSGTAALDPTGAAAERRRAEQLNDELSAHASATEVLQRWCRARRLGDPPVVVARRIAGVDKPASAGVRALLRARRGDRVGYRRVALACGPLVLCEADNWYLPGELTAAMNAELASTDRPFGLVVRPLGYRRVRLEARVLSGRQGVVRQRALLVRPDGTPISYVVETYSSAVLGEGP